MMPGLIPLIHSKSSVSVGLRQRIREKDRIRLRYKADQWETGIYQNYFIHLFVKQ